MKGSLKEVEPASKSVMSLLTNGVANREGREWASPGESGRHRLVFVMKNPTLLTSLPTYSSRQWPVSFISNQTVSILSVALRMSSIRNSHYFSPPEQPDSVQRYSAYVGGLPVYVCHRSGEDIADGVQLLRYTTVPQSQDNSTEYLNQPKSEVADMDDCVRYDSQDLGRDYYPDSEVSSASTYSPIVVVAIDFGTTYSGYAFSFLQDPDDIHMMRKWEG